MKPKTETTTASLASAAWPPSSWPSRQAINHAAEFSARLSGFNEIGSIPTSVTVSALNTPSPTS